MVGVDVSDYSRQPFSTKSRNAARMTALTVRPSRLARVTAASHRSSGTRTFRDGLLATVQVFECERLGHLTERSAGECGSLRDSPSTVEVYDSFVVVVGDAGPTLPASGRSDGRYADGLCLSGHRCTVHACRYGVK